MIYRSLLLLLATVALALPSGAQSGPPADSGAAAKDLVQGKLGDSKSVRDNIRKSGLSPEEVRAKLTAAGMKGSILDDYLSSAAGGSGAPNLSPTADVLAAVAVLGTADATAQNAATQQPVVPLSTLPPGTSAAAAAAQGPILANLPTTEKGLPVFGLDIFRRGSTQFEANAVGPVDANYRLGPLDVVAVILTGQTELSHSLEVTRDGFIVIPQVGQVFVANLTLGQATQVIVQKLRQSYEGAGTSPNAPTRVYVTVARLRTNQIFIIGEVAAPGSYQVSAAGTALTALYAAGGPTINGRVRDIEIRRGGRTVSTVDLYNYLLRGDASGDIRLETGDQIFVAANPKHVTINGEVARPAIYELKAGETLERLMSYAGGLKTTAARSRVQISRVLPPSERQPGGRDRTVIDVLGDPEAPNGAAAATPLQPADVVTVTAVSERIRNRLSVTGSVWTPGPIALRPGLRLSEALTLAGGLLPDTYKDEVQLVRTLPNEQRERISVRLDSLGNPVNDIVLREDDEIRVFSNTEFRTTRNVTLSGAARRSVNIPFVQGVTLRDLVLLAGEFESDTNVIGNASVSRILPDLTRETFVVPIRDSTGRWNAISLQAGDAVRVFSSAEFRTQRNVSVAGPLRRPVEVPYERGISLRDLIFRGGGFENEVDLMNEVSVSRLLPNLTRESLVIPLRDSTGAWNTTPLREGDILRIYSQAEFRTSRNVSVVGPLRRAVEGPYQNGITLRDLILRGGGFENEVDLMNEVSISRLLPNLTRQSLVVPLRDSTGNWNALPLQPGDVARIYSNAEFRTQRNVSLSGGVRKGVDISWQRGVTLRDLVLLGGGFESDVDVLDTVTVSRLQPDLTRRSFTMPLRDSAGDLSTVQLEPGDQLRMYTRSQFRPGRTIKVGGAVRSSTEIPFTEGMTLRQALLAAGGLDESALLTRVQIARLPARMEAGHLADIISVALDSSYVFERGPDGKYLGPQGVPASTRPTREFYLKPFDQINVLRQPEWDLGGSVTLTGEVRFPGAYPLLHRDETLKDIIKRAGGLTDQAYAEGAVFTRPVPASDIAARKKLIEQVRRDRAYAIAIERVNDRSTTVTPTTTSNDAIAAENKALADVLVTQDSAAERIAINLPNALRVFPTRDNLTVRSGDALYIPLLNPTVTVRGFVGAPSTLPYRPGLSMRQYIDLAGGPTVNGDLGHAIVQQPNGQVEPFRQHRFRPDESPTLLAGSVIVVPPYESRRSEFPLAQVLSSLVSFATAAVAIVSISRR